MNDNNNRYSVYVDGIEVNDYYLTIDEAEKLKDEYEHDEYDDVAIVKNEEKGDTDVYRNTGA